ncbi:MAG: thrombospondin type 3 repeat-containing protein, partial [Phycisphaerae bacterium]|nr:thrombospondin type 3 repeat-containing protein [Phycisphaerae bacterium]
QNSAPWRGGGMDNWDNCNPTLTNCVFTANTTENSGGGMFNWQSNPALTTCTFSNNTAAYGGGMYNDTASNPTLDNCTFAGNSAEFGGGMQSWNSTPQLTDCIFTANTAVVAAGGMNNQDSDSTLFNCRFDGNVAGDNSGAMHNWSSDPVLTNCVFTGNTATNFNGGAMHNDTGSPTLTNCTFEENVATGFGGGMNNYSGNPVLTSCAFRGNAAGDSGGGLCSWEESSPTVTECSFINNSAVKWGGGMASWFGSPLLTGCLFSDNTADGGGGLYYSETEMATVINCAFTGNAATHGGAVYNWTSSPELTVCTLSGNTAAEYGGGMHNGDSNPTLTNCILWGNSDCSGTNVSSQIHSGSPVVSYSCVQDNNPDDGWVYPGNGNTDDNPLFLDADGPDEIFGTEDDNLRLRAGSPCIDAGSNGAVPPDSADLDDDGDTAEPTPFDLDGNPRFIDDPTAPDTGAGTPPLVDMGAYEYQEDCNTNGVIDSADIAYGTSRDCNSNGIPDECEAGNDCNGNTIPDECDIAGGTSEDCQLNGIPDECDIAAGTSYDCTNNGIPDECEDDCNQNGIRDDCDIAAGTSYDCNVNMVPDECDMDAGTSRDCNTNGIPDECDIHAGTSNDCNNNNRPDECDVMRCSYLLWDGFTGFASNTPMHGFDAIPYPDGGDGSLWLNPKGNAKIDRRGCEGGSLADKAVQVSVPGSTGIPEEWYVSSEHLQPYYGVLGPEEQIYSLSFRVKLGLNLDPATDWQFSIRDATNDRAVVVIQFCSTVSWVFPGSIVVKNALGQYIDTGVTIEQDICYEIKAVLDNDLGTLAVYIDGGLKVLIPLESGARRMDYFRVDTVGNGSGNTVLATFKLDHFDLCLRGGLAVPLDEIPDCNTNSVLDECDIAAGTSQDCNSNGYPDECEPDSDDDGTIDDCDNCPEVANPDQADFDNDGVGNVCDDDIDNDGVLNDDDVCDYTPLGLPPELIEPDGSVLGDLDGDCDVDLDDFALMQARFTGPNP